MRRLYFIFPDVDATQKVVDKLLLKRIDINHIHVVARPGTPIGDLPEASLFQRRDLRHSLIIGAVLGLFLGVAIGFAFHQSLHMPIGGIMMVTVILGILLGSWGASMIGMTADNVEFTAFQKDIDAGKILLIIEVPKERIDEIEKLFEQEHPEASFTGQEPTVPPFP